jgi:hypothetical protein
MRCPSAKAMPKAIAPEMKNRSDEIINGGADCTMIRAEVNALLQIRAKVKPIKIDRKSILTP